MPYIDLSELLTTENHIDVFEINLFKNTINQEHAKVIDLVMDNDIIKAVENKFRNPKVSSYKSYYMNDKIYTYDLENDNQIVISKHKVNSKIIRRHRCQTDALIMSYKIDKYPPYTFPCTDEIDYISSYTIKEFKINNRITVNIRTEDGESTVYIEYRHSDNVELDKVNEIIGKLLYKL